MNSTITQLIKIFSQLPGMNQRTVKKMCFTLLKNKALMDNLIEKLTDCRENVRECDLCAMYTESPTSRCAICSNNKRNRQYVCIVADMMNLLAIEKTQAFTGVYYVLHNMLSNVNGIVPSDLNVDKLIAHLQENNVTDVLIGLSPTMEGQATSHFLNSVLSDIVNVKQLNIGISLGSDLEYLDSRTIAYSLPVK